MRLTTIFRAYKDAMNGRERCLSNRGDIWGIGVADDYWAIRFQNYERKAIRFERYLFDNLQYLG